MAPDRPLRSDSPPERSLLQPPASAGDDTARLRAALEGRYRIEKQLGAGGMAVVYLARDLKHDRPVALKMLRPDLSAVIGTERFLVEIRTLAQLQHPHLVPLFDSGVADGLLFYVMPVIDGESLRDLLHRDRQLSLEQAHRITSQVASALDYAHARGVVHRDVKPENILLLGDQAMIADFGIARAVSNAGGTRLTETGISLGTPHYMSPEQATAEREVDSRSDIYSLGAVVYEMLAGEPPHRGPTAQAIISRLLTQEPQAITATRPSIPAHVDEAVRRALAKVPADRWSRASELAAAIVAQPLVPAPSRRSASARRTWLPMAAVAGVAAVVAALGTRVLTPRDVTSLSFVMEPLPVGDSMRLSDIELSNDGRVLALRADNGLLSRVFVRSLASLGYREVTSATNAISLAMSAAGDRFASVSISGEVVVTDLATNASRTLGRINIPYGGAHWHGEELLVGNVSDSGETAAGQPIAAYPQAGGAPRFITRPPPGHGDAVPITADDGTMYFMRWGPGYTEDDFIGIARVDGGTEFITKLRARRPLGVIDDHLVYDIADGSIMATPLKDLRGDNPAARSIHLAEALTGPQGAASLAATGSLAYLRNQFLFRAVIIDSTGSRPFAGTERPFVYAVDGPPRLSADGRVALVQSVQHRGSTGTADVWLLDGATGTMTQVTRSGKAVLPSWMPDGRRLMYAEWFEDKPGIWLQSLDDGSEPELVHRLAQGARILSLAPVPDGSGVTYCELVDGRSEQSFFLAFGSRTPVAVTSGCSPRVSPDGRWLAYAELDGDVHNVYVRPFRRPGSRTRVENGGIVPQWGRDGRLFYLQPTGGNSTGQLLVARLADDGDRVRVLRRDRLFGNDEYIGFDLVDGGRRVATYRTSVQPTAHVVTNWAEHARDQIRAAKR